MCTPGFPTCPFICYVFILMLSCDWLEGMTCFQVCCTVIGQIFVSDSWKHLSSTPVSDHHVLDWLAVSCDMTFGHIDRWRMSHWQLCKMWLMQMWLMHTFSKWIIFHWCATKIVFFYFIKYWTINFLEIGRSSSGGDGLAFSVYLSWFTWISLCFCKLKKI